MDITTDFVENLYYRDQETQNTVVSCDSLGRCGSCGSGRHIGQQDRRSRLHHEQG